MKKTENKNAIFKSEVHDYIPGGAHTYSKGDDQFPDNAPAAISHGKGAWVWDLEGNKYLDCSMGLTSVSLGHAYPDVLEDVWEEMQKGVNFQRPSYIELEMAKQFLALIPQHAMVKFAKNGSTVTTAAVKLARAYTGRKLIAFPADHPFYSYDDWFIGSTVCDKGVPEEITQLSVTFKSCDIESLQALFAKYPGQIAAVITEPEKPHCNVNCTCSQSVGEFLTEAIKLTRSEGSIFILDEMVTGFKTDLPGSISKYGLDPDLATWGKGIANGFSFCALTGKKEIMELGGIRNTGEEKVFLISTTHGAETHALRAGIKTIEIFKAKNVIDHIRSTALKLESSTKDIIQKYRLVDFIEVQGKDWILGFVFKNKDKKIDAVYRTYFLKQMFSQGILFQGAFVPCLSHNDDELKCFLEAFEKACVAFKSAVEEGVDLVALGSVIKPVFRKYL
jgi:glutamate-1-semialdehyde 2,1-aminomutase